MRVFVTGASGFVGQAAIAMLIKHGHQVLGMSRTARSDQIIRASGAVAVKCALNNVEQKHLAGCDAVVHTAALIGQWAPYKKYFDDNVTGTQRIIQAAKDAGVKKFIHISTESVLFNGSNLININESHPYPPTPFFYAKSKQLAEQMVVQENMDHVFETICIRPGKVWGMGDHVTLPLLKTAVEQKQFKWIDGGKYVISVTHVVNLAHAIVLALENARGSQVYFVADEAISIKKFYSLLLATQNLIPPENSLPKWLVRPAAYMLEKCWLLLRLYSKPVLTRFGAALFSTSITLDTTKIRKELNYTPLISLEEGMQQLTLQNRQSFKA